MQEIFYLARHTPFWAVPLMVLGAEFGYLYWLKKKKLSALFCLLIAGLGTACVGFYMWAGGPEKTVKIIKKFYLYYFT
jgi:hypothetical protein